MNKQLILINRPEGIPDENTWKIEENTIPEPAPGEIVIKQEYVSLDPAMRGWLNDKKSYLPPVGIGEVMRSGSIGKVIKSNGNKNFQEGDCVVGWGGVQQYTLSDGERWRKVDPSLAPMPLYLSTLGMPGMTAYFGILDVGKIKEGETVLISGAAGAVGSIVGQIAKIKGCKVVGIAGGEKKCTYIKEELGFDAAIDYKTEDVDKAIKSYLPDGIDVYFDNVGGELLDIALDNLRMYARVVICGAISQYNNPDSVKGPDNYLSLLVNRGTMQGMIVMDYEEHYGKAAIEMSGWLSKGKIKSREAVYEGIENFLPTFLRLFSGDKMGKLILKI